MKDRLPVLGIALMLSGLIINGCEFVTETAAPTMTATISSTATPTTPPTPSARAPEMATPTPPKRHTYSNDEYGFTFSYLSTWVLEEMPAGKDVAGGKSANAVHLTQGWLRLVIQFKNATEATVLGLGGLPAGEVEDRGTATFLGREIPRHVLVFEGKDKSVFYDEQFEDLEFYLQLGDDPDFGLDYGTVEIPESVQAEVDEFLATFARTREPVYLPQELVTYHNAAYDFALEYPTSWTLEKASNALILSQGTQALTIEFRRDVESTRIGPSGTPAGEFVDQGAVSVLGQTIPRSVLVFEGLDKGVYYNDTSPIKEDDMEFVIILSENNTDAQATLPEVVQAEADQIVQSLVVARKLPMPSATACANQISFIADITIPDDTILAAEEAFVKTWRLRNSGTCTWDTGYSLVCVSEECLDSADAVPVRDVVPPGDTVDLSVDMIAPSASGTYTATWQMRDTYGNLFGVGGIPGDPFWVRVVVGTPASELTNYTNSAYQFAFQYPPSWDLQEAPHTITLGQGSLALTIAYRRVTEDVIIGSSDLPSGELVERRMVKILEQDVPRMVLVDQGNDKGVYYGGAATEIQAGDLAFVVVLSERDSDPSFSIPEDIQNEVDVLVRSLALVLAPPQ